MGRQEHKDPVIQTVAAASGRGPRLLDRRPGLGYIHPRRSPTNLAIPGRNVTISIRLQAVPLAQIDLAESVLESAPAADLERLAASLREVGLINPPWLRPQPGGERFRVVTGARAP